MLLWVIEEEQSSFNVFIHTNIRQTLRKSPPHTNSDLYSKLYVLGQKHTKSPTERFLIRQNKTECKFSRESSSSKPRTIQKQTNNLAAASWVLPEECVNTKSCRSIFLLDKNYRRRKRRSRRFYAPRSSVFLTSSSTTFCDSKR